jgi:hypothetical protein
MTPLLPRPQSELLQAVGRFRYLTKRLGTRLFYQPTSIEYVGELLKALTDAGYLGMFQFSRVDHGIWHLTERGRKLLRDHEFDPGPRGQDPSKYSYAFVEHTLAANEAVIAALTLPRSLTSVVVDGFFSEHELRRSFLRSAADGWVALRIDGRPEGLWIEADQGHVIQRDWREKVARIIAFYESGQYEETFGTGNLVVATFVPTDHRRDLLATWTAKELERLDRAAWKSFFYVTAAPLATEAVSLYFGEHWLTAEGEVQPLFRGGDGGA